MLRPRRLTKTLTLTYKSELKQQIDDFLSINDK